LTTRRGFLVASLGGGVAFGFIGADRAAPGAPPRFEPTLWYDIDAAGIVTVHIIYAEMGQHVGTAIARILADELEADWSKVRIDHVDLDRKWGDMSTGGSASVFTSFPIMSRAAAAGRITLIEAAAKLLGVSPDACVARNGLVMAGATAVSYGDIVARGRLSRTFTADELSKLPIKPASDRRLIGTSAPALDIPAKTNGQAHYGIDASVPGMIYARPKIPPTRYDSAVESVDDSEAKAVPGYLRSLTLDDPSGHAPGWVMVLAETFVAADRAAEKVKVTWRSGRAANVSEDDLQHRAQALIDDPATGARLVDDAGVEAAFSGARRVLEATYTTSTALHFQMEPLNALVFEKDGVFEIHTGNQWQTLAAPWVAKAVGVAPDKVVLRTYRLGGGFGRRLNGDYVVPAALAAKATGRPVKMVFTRSDDVRFDSPRSPTMQRLRMAFGEAGRVLAMDHAAAAGWPNLAMSPDDMPKDASGVVYDLDAINGADHWYSVGAHRVRAICNDLANTTFRPGWLRSVGPGWTNWAVESFIDEAAHATGQDPVAFRLALLDGAGGNAGGAGRQAMVLERLAKTVGWGEAQPPDVGLGIATSFGQGRDMPTWTACAARVRIDRETGAVKVEKLDLVIDAGTIVDPDGASAQVEGAALWGLSLALFEGTQFVNGQVADTNLDTYAPLRMRDTPAVAVAFIASAEPPVGLGEPGVTVVAPAIANAIFAATGARLRHLPIRREDVLAALKARA
jgi:CO/xanthine dehydrogenase Mo-binding subunit